MERQGPDAEEEESSALLCWEEEDGCLSQAGGKVFVRGRRGRAVVVGIVRYDGGARGGLSGLFQLLGEKGRGCWLEFGNWRPEGGVGR